MHYYELMIMTLSVMMIMTNHPVLKSLIVLLQALTVAVMCGMIMGNFWFSYILFLTMIGGMMVIFLYMTNVASNEKISVTIFGKNIFVLFFLMTIMLSFFDKLYWSSNLSTHQMYKEQFDLMINKFFFYPFNLIMMIMMIYLLVTLVMTVKMTQTNKGPLRTKK